MQTRLYAALLLAALALAALAAQLPLADGPPVPPWGFP
jgi:hypothetical protein